MDENVDKTTEEQNEQETNDEGIGHHNQELGKRGEAAAVRYLALKGYEILDRNWTCPAGEADIVANDGDSVVFVEVKTRTSLEKGYPCEAVTCEKRHKYERIAAYYLKDHNIKDIRVRFDIVDLLVVAKDRALVKHIVDAFCISYGTLW